MTHNHFTCILTLVIVHEHGQKSAGMTGIRSFRSITCICTCNAIEVVVLSLAVIIIGTCSIHKIIQVCKKSFWWLKTEEAILRREVVGDCMYKLCSS